jgi:osmotically-inducible protein OsmY
MRIIAGLFVLIAIGSAGCGGTGVSAGTSVTSSRFTASELIARVKTALLNDKEIGARRIDVHAADGDITLTGRVASTAERDRAVQITRGVEGVRSVRSELQIQP